MKVSTKGIYAIEAMTDLAIHSEHGVENIKNIAARRQLSEKYLEQIIGALRKGKLIKSTRGASGGYQLAKSPETITVYDILEAVENNMTFLECLEREVDCGMNPDLCITRSVWSAMWDEILTVTEEVTLSDLVKASEKLRKETVPEYYI